MTKTSFKRVDYNNINNCSEHLSIPFDNSLPKLKFWDRLAAEIVHQFLICVKAQII